MKFKKAIIHCSDSTFGDVLLINKWHRERGWDEIGYHYVILNGKISSRTPFNSFLDGGIQPGRSINKIGAHCKGHNNTLGVCLIGKYSFSSLQFTRLAELMRYYEFSKYNIYGHREFNTKKTCPNFNVSDWINGYYWDES